MKFFCSTGDDMEPLLITLKTAFDALVCGEGRPLVWRVDKKQRPIVGDKINLRVPSNEIFLLNG